MTNAVACFTFDNMAEAAEVGAGTRSGPRTDVADPSLSRGYPSLYRLLATHGVPATFFVEGWNGVHHPEAVAEIVRRGHELVCTAGRTRRGTSSIPSQRRRSPSGRRRR